MRQSAPLEEPEATNDSSSPAAGSFSRRRFLLGAGAVSAVAIYSNEFARHQVVVEERTIRIASLPPAFHGYRIIQLSDLHLDEYTEPGFLEHVISRVNTIPCDIVLITGDFVSTGPLPFRYAIDAAGRCGEMLQKLKAPLRFGCLGNHDSAVGGPAVMDRLESTGTPILSNRYLPLERQGQRLWLCGMGDPGTDHDRIEFALPKNPDGPVILMSHEPDYIDRFLADPLGRNIDLALSGHSHGGQIRLPHMRPLILPPMGEKYYEGLYRFGRAQLYVTRGIGTVGVPFRLFCPPEISVLTLQPATEGVQA